MKDIRIVADCKIPYLRGVLEPYAAIEYLAPGQITAQAVRDADILLVRTRTRCDRALLENSRCRYIATATIGYDHIDTAYCRERGILWENAPGCNASSVGQYILSTILLWSEHTRRKPSQCTIGIVGVGHVGRIVARYCELLGMRVLLNDPPRQAAEGGASFVSLEAIAREADIITFHTPLTHTGAYPTYHLADDKFFNSLARKPLVINSARGEIVDGKALLQALNNRQIEHVVLDCWENEPLIDQQLLHRSFIATPHIAGYSADGKSTATRMVVEAVGRWTGITIPTHTILPPAPTAARLDLSGSPSPIYQAVKSTYDPTGDDARLRNAPASFEHLREAYPLRREFSAYTVTGVDDTTRETLQKLGFCTA